MFPRVGALLGECMANCKAYYFGGKRVSCAKTVESILTISSSYDVILCKKVRFGIAIRLFPIYGV